LSHSASPFWSVLHTLAPIVTHIHLHVPRTPLLLPWPVRCTHAMHCCSRGQFVAHTLCTAAPVASSLHTRHALLLSWPAPRTAHFLPCISVVNYVVAAMHIHTSQFTQCTDRCCCCCSSSSCCCCCHARVHTRAKILLVGSIAAIMHTRQLSSSAASSSGSKHDRGRSEHSSARPVTWEAPGASAHTTGDGGVYDDDDDE
jgi:hypothetical protein